MVLQLVVEEVKRMMTADSSTDATQTMNAIVIDHYLWDLRREKAAKMEHIPFHRVRCVYY